jgi:serine/threonine protein kinase
VQIDPTASSPRFLGKYEVLARLDSGGMAEIFLARARGLAGFEKLVVLKRILPHLAAEEEFVSLFLDEAKTTVALSHGNIVQVFDMGRGEDGDYFIAMEYVAGKNLRRLIRRHVEKQGQPFDVALATWIVGEILRGLDYAHRRTDSAGRPLGIVHRDLSPHNILISYEGEVKVADFGIAKAASKVVHTETGLIRGKASYMSPEQAQADPLDNRSDIFATGILLYELLTGLPPYPGENPQLVLRALTQGDPPAPPSSKRSGISPELDRTVLRALARRPEDRYPSSDLFLRDLGQYLVSTGEVVGPRDLAAHMTLLFSEEIEEERKQISALPKVVELPVATARPQSGFAVPPLDPKEQVPTLRFQTPRDPMAPIKALTQSPAWARWAIGAAIPILLGGVFLFAKGEWFQEPVPTFVPTATPTAVVLATTVTVATPTPVKTPTPTPVKTHPRPTPTPTSVALVETPAVVTISPDRKGAYSWGYVFVDGKPVTGADADAFAGGGPWHGQRLRTTPFNLELKPGRHVVKLVQLDAATGEPTASGEQTVELTAGQTLALKIALKAPK